MSKILNIDLAQNLKVKPKKVIDYLKVPLGSQVKKGDLIAQKKGLLSSEINIFSQIDGLLEKLDETTGLLKIIKKDDDVLIKKDVGKSQKAKPIAERIKGVFGFGKNKGLLLIKDKKLSLPAINVDMQEKIIAAPSMISRGVLYKASALGIAGIIVENCSSFWQKEFMATQKKLKDNFAFLCLGKNISILNKMKEKPVLCLGEKKLLKIYNS